MTNCSNTIRLVMPQWQGGNNPAYKFGAEMLNWLAPETDAPVIHVPIQEPAEPLSVENGIIGREALKTQLSSVWKIIREYKPDNIVTFGGDCLVDLAPFAWLSERWGEKLGILWIDSHPDVMTPAQFQNAHAHVLGALMGNGDPDLTTTVVCPVPSRRVMIAGIHSPLEYEKKFIADNAIRTCSPNDVRAGGESVMKWIEEEKIECLAIHIDLDVLDENNFRSVLFARPGAGEHDFAGIAKGKLNIPDVLALIQKAASRAKVVGLGIAEHLPWDAMNLKDMLEQLPLIGRSD
ncbi:arginase [Photorhabdus luminescens]|nr:arginase [Photorhabdus luminescens]